MQRRLAARQEELDDDFSYARELRDREKRLRALEEERERKARWAGAALSGYFGGFCQYSSFLKRSIYVFESQS